MFSNILCLKDPWCRRYYGDRLFSSIYSKKIFEMPFLKGIRNRRYIKRYKMGSGCYIQYNVDIHQEHHLGGKISIGKNVLLAKNVFIDYSGFVEIKDNVQLTNGVIIESHHHPWHSDYILDRDSVNQTSIIIEEGAVIGSQAIILASCHYIGKHARVGAGAVVTHDVPDYSVAVGSPAKVVRIQNNSL